MATGTIKNPSKQYQWTSTRYGLSYSILRIGNVCTLYISGATNSAISASAQLTNSWIPTGYLPTETVEAFNYDRSFTVYLNSAGQLRTREAIASGKACSVSATYLTTNVEPT